MIRELIADIRDSPEQQRELRESLLCIAVCIGELAVAQQVLALLLGL